MSDPQLFLHRSHRMEDLASLLAQHLREAGKSEDPLLAQRVVVGSRGMERWLRQQLSLHNGICANIDFSFPQAVLDEIVQRLEPDAASSAVDPWNPDSLAWRLAGTIRELEQRPELLPVRTYLGDKEPAGSDVLGIRCWGLAREAADLLDAYALQRPQWLEAWDRGESASLLPSGTEADWQRSLWLEARRTTRPREPFPMRARRVLEALRQGRTGPLQPVHVFGVSSLPPLFLQLFAALSHHVRVGLYLFAPSLEYWADYASRHAKAREAGLALEIEQALENQNPLLTALGHVSRDMQKVILEHADPARDEPVPSPPEDEPACLLHHMQRDIRSLVSVSEMRRLQPGRLIARDDDSVQVHASHGPARQVEVLRDVLLDLIERRQIPPRQVIVMTPDVETFAPLIQAVFQQGPSARREDGTWGPDGAPPIPVEIADRSLRSTNAIADALLRVLEMAEARSTASKLLDLLGLFPVRARAGISEEQLAQVQSWAVDAGVRWGADASDRVEAGQPDDDQNTWLFGMRRLALGLVMEADDELITRADGGELIASTGGTWGDAFDTEGALLFGRFATMVRAVLARVRALRQARTMPEWLDALIEVVDAITEVTPATSWLREQVLDSLESLREESASYVGKVSLGVMRRVLDGRFDIPRQGDRRVSGAVTVCSLQPMRNVPFQVVCLLGMDDGSFPRPTLDRGIDLMRANRLAGDRDAREEDRHLVLEALMAARSHFVVVHGARDPHTNTERPPAGPIADLLDCIDQGFSLPEAAQRSDDQEPPPARKHVIVEHGLQPFSPAEFTTDGRVFKSISFDGRARMLALQLRKERTGELDPFRDGGELEPPEEVSVAIDALADGLLNPARLILKTLGVSIPDSEEGLSSDREPVEIDGLLGWVLGDAMGRAALEAAVRGGSEDAVVRACNTERRRLAAQGKLPLGAAGRHAVKDKIDGAKAMIAKLREETELAGARSLPIEQRIDVAEGLVVSVHGEVGPVTSEGDLIQFEFKDASDARPALRAWVRLIAARVAHEDGVRRAIIVDSKRKTYLLTPPQDARGALIELLRLRRLSRRIRIPLLRKTSCAVAKALFAPLRDGPWAEADEALQEAVLSDAEESWEGEQASRGDSADRWVQVAWGDTVPFLKRDQLDPGFVQLAEAVWKPLLVACPELAGLKKTRQPPPEEPSESGKKSSARASRASKSSGKSKGSR